jgi:hypothetical protein
MKAPAIKKPMALSAYLILNVWQTLASLIHYLLFGTASSGLFSRKQQNYHNPDDGDFSIHALLFHRNEHQLCIVSDITDITDHVKINDVVVNPDSNSGNKYYYVLPPEIKNNQPYYVKMGSWSNKTLNPWPYADFFVAQPYEVPSSHIMGPSINLNDFLSGTPTVKEWNDVSDALNAMDLSEFVNTENLGVIYNLTNSLTDVDNVEEVKTITHITHGYNDLYARFMVGWPKLGGTSIGDPNDEENPPRFGYREIYTMSVKLKIKDTSGNEVYSWRTSLTQTRNFDTINLLPGEGDINVEVQSIREFDIGDTVQIKNCLHTTFTITNLSGNDSNAQMNLHYNNTGTEESHIFNRSPLESIPDATYNNSGLQIYPHETVDGNERHYQIKFPTDSFAVDSVYDVEFDLVYRRKSGGGFDPYNQKTTLYYIGEYKRGDGSDSFDLLAMIPFEKCDKIPGETQEKSINQIILNIRRLQNAFNSYNGTKSNDGCDSINDVYEGHIGVHKYDYWAIQGEEDGDTKAQVKYWNGVEWIEDELSYSQDLEYYKISDKFPNMVKNNFYYIKGPVFATEVDKDIQGEK